MVWEMAIIIVMLKNSGKLQGISTFLCNKGIELPILTFIPQNAPSGSLHSSGEGKQKSSYGLSLVTSNAMREGPDKIQEKSCFKWNGQENTCIFHIVQE